GATSYEVYVNGSSTPAATPTASSAVVGGLTNGTTYSFTVKAKNQHGLGPASSAVNGTPQAPPPEQPVPNAPTNLQGTAGDGQASLSWTASSGATSYEVYIVGNGTPVKTVTGTSTTITGLTNGQSYSFNVRARNSTGLSAASSSVAVNLNLAGAVVWAKRGGGTGGDIGYSMAAGPDGTLYMTGYFQGTATF